MPKQTPSIASEYGFLDSDCVGDGRPLDAHVLRTIARNSNRLALRSQILSSLVWYAGGAADTPIETHQFYALPYWQQITPKIPIVKKPYILDAKLMWMCGASDDSPIGLQAATDACPFDPTLPVAESKSVTVINGTGSTPFYGDTEGIKYNIPLREGAATESVTYYVRGGLGDLGSTGTYGTPNSGTIEKIDSLGNKALIRINSGAWNDFNDATDWSKGGHAFVFKNGASDTLLKPRVITFVESSNELMVWPDVPDDFRGDVLRGADFEIRKLPIIRLHSLMLYGIDGS